MEQCGRLSLCAQTERYKVKFVSVSHRNTKALDDGVCEGRVVMVVL